MSVVEYSDFCVYSQHDADAGSFLITPSEGTLVGSKAIMSAGYLGASTLTLDSDTDPGLTWTVDGEGVGTAELKLDVLDVADLRAGVNAWQLTIELASGERVFAISGTITKIETLV